MKWKSLDERAAERWEQQKRERRERWPEEEEAIQQLAELRTPLNDRFASGLGVGQGQLLRYICALERRVAELEEKRG